MGSAWMGQRCCQRVGGLRGQLGKKVAIGRAASRLASLPPRKHTSFIQNRLFWVKALYVLRRQELCSPSQLPLLHISPGCYNQAAPAH